MSPPAQTDADDTASSATVALGYTLGLETAFETGVEWAAAEGFEFIELLLDRPYLRERIHSDVEAMRSVLTDQNVGIVVHLPFAVAPSVPFEPVRAGIVEEFKRGMDLAADLGANRIVFHPGSNTWDQGWTATAQREFVHDVVDELVPAATTRGLTPCLENIVSSYYDATTFPELLARFPDASMTFDTSHAFLAGLTGTEVAAFCRTHADRIGHLHLVDTRSGDEHLPVGMGTIAFEPLFETLSDIGWCGTATLEINTTDLDTVALGKKHTQRLLAAAGP